MNEDHPELALCDTTHVYGALCALLPSRLVYVRNKQYRTPCAPSIAQEIIADALVNGYHIDRSNGEGPLSEWDGCLLIETPGSPTFIECDKSKVSQG